MKLACMVAFGAAIQLATCSCALYAATPVGVVLPAEYGARGDGVTDDTEALRRALVAASGATLRLPDGAVFLVSGPLEVKAKTNIKGKATFKVAPTIEQTVGVRGGDGVLVFAKTAAGSTLSGLTVDLSGKGRNAVDVQAATMVVDGLTVRNYNKDKKSDGVANGTSESGLRVHASNVQVRNVNCEDMRTGQPDAVPRCVSVQGNAIGVSLNNIKGRRINGGITVGASTGVRIDTYDFRELTDNGLYLLPDAAGVVALNGYLENTEEPVVFKGADARVSGLKIHNQRVSIGLENATNVTLENVQVSFGTNFKATPAFIRTRKKNHLTTNVQIRNVTAKMPLGGSVFAFATGEIVDVSVTDSTFDLLVAGGSQRAPFIVRQRQGKAVRLDNTSFRFYGAGADQLVRVRIALPPGSPSLAAVAPKSTFLKNGQAVRAEIVE